MLFDLRGPGRRRAVKVVYVTLALLMGGGLVFFGIGGDVSGGLVDAITERGAGGDDGSERFQEREEQALAATRRNPQDAAAWLALTRARVQLAGTGDRYDPNTGQYTEEGRRELREASQAWERYLALDPDPPDERVARLMVQAHVALGNLRPAVNAQQIVANAADTSSAFAQLAVLAYQAGQTRVGDLARRRAIQLEEPDQRNVLRSQLDQARTQAQAGAAAGAQEGAQAP